MPELLRVLSCEMITEHDLSQSMNGYTDEVARPACCFVRVSFTGRVKNVKLQQCLQPSPSKPPLRCILRNFKLHNWWLFSFYSAWMRPTMAQVCQPSFLFAAFALYIGTSLLFHPPHPWASALTPFQ